MNISSVQKKVSEVSDSLDYSPERESKILSDGGGNNDLYESNDRNICEKSPLKATQDFVDQEFNASQDFAVSGMNIVED